MATLATAPLAGPRPPIAVPAWVGLALIWLAGSALLMDLFIGDIAQRIFSDPDDYLRLQEVRDWLAGQSWFDVTQYRIGPPTGLLMHWSRLVDMPLAAIITLLRPFTGEANAELAASIIVPLITLGIIAALAARLAGRLSGARTTYLAMAMMMMAPPVLGAARPMRIDHHGWQVVCAMAMAVALIGNRCPRRAAIAGAFGALWMHISLEGIVFTAGCSAWLGLRWIWDGDSERFRLPALLASLTCTSLILFVIAHGGALFDRTFCDAVSPVHIIALAVSTVGTLACVRLCADRRAVRFGALCACGSAAALVYRLGAPQCAGGPFGALDPLSYRLWYMTVAEGLPLWKQTALDAAMATVYPILGLVGAAIAWRQASPERRGAWLDLLALLAIATVVGCLLIRAASVSNALAVPGAIGLLVAIYGRVRTWSAMPARVVATAFSVMLVMPLSTGLAAVAVVPNPAAVDHIRAVAIRTERRCMTRANLAALRSLPPSLFLTPLDEAPALIVETNHFAVASGYHRNVAMMHDVLAFFTADGATVPAGVAHRHPDYLFFCPGDSDMRLLAQAAPHGLAAKLNANAAPAWLQPVAVPGLRYARVYRLVD